MMSPTQKRFAEIPLLLFLIWMLQALEISILRLPGGRGTVDLIPVLITYFALTRTWGALGLLALSFSVIGSFTVGIPLAVYVAVLVWTALLTKAVVLAFALEGRKNFVALVAASFLLSKLLIWILLKSLDSPLPTSVFLRSLPTGLAVSALCGWFLFPWCVAWDEFFQHPVAESRELNPDILR